MRLPVHVQRWSSAALRPAFRANPHQGNFQVSPYGLIATPYCEEEQIARVAQSRGFNVSAAEVHNNALKKVYLCQVIGFDNRLKGSCAGYGPDSFGRAH